VCKFNIDSCYGEVLHALEEATVVQSMDLTGTKSLLSVVQKIPENDHIFWRKSVCFRRNDKMTVLVVEYAVQDDNIMYNGGHPPGYFRGEVEDPPGYFRGEVEDFWMLKDENQDWSEGTNIERDLREIDRVCIRENHINSDLCEKVLDIIEKRYVSTTPMRSINPIQWSKSQQKSSNESQSCKEAVEKAEILQTLLGNDDKVNREQAEQIFDQITCPLVYKFHKTKDGNIIIEHRNDYPPETKQVPLLKTPEGIIEAQQLALLLSHEEFLTLCFEEPDRGMHPKMIEQLLQVLMEEENKTYLVVTHSPYFINTSTAKLTHVCVRRKDRDVSKSVHTVHSLANSEKVHKITDTDELKKILFSSRILCVEGKTDKIFVETIFEFIRNHGHRCLSKENIQFILGHQVIVQNSNTFQQVIRSICSPLNVACTVLLDRDAVIRPESKTNPKSIGHIRLTGFSDKQDMFDSWNGKPITEFLKSKDYEKLSNCLQRENTFIWKQGNLEDTIQTAYSQKKDLLTQLFGNESVKKTICSLDRTKLTDLATEMCRSKEIESLLEFFKAIQKEIRT
jgi:hypothetical protein